MELKTGRVGGTLGHTGPAGGYLSVMILIACSAIWGVFKNPVRLLAGICAIAGSIALVSTGSRIGWAGTAITLPVFLLAGLNFGWIKREVLILIFIATLTFGLIFSPEIYTRLTADDNGSSNTRLMMWKLAIRIIGANPWLGVGAGNYALATRDYYSSDIGRADEVIDIQVHNAYLGVWGEGGIFAFLSYISLLGAAIWSAWSCARSPSRFISITGISLSLGIISLCVQMVTGTFHMRSITLFVWLMIALAACLRNIRNLDPYAD